MALSTFNRYGNINISDNAVAVVVSRVALDCYGVVELVSRRLSDSIMMLFNREPLGKGVKIVTMDNRIFVDLYVILKPEEVGVLTFTRLTLTSTAKYKTYTFALVANALLRK